MGSISYNCLSVPDKGKFLNHLVKLYQAGKLKAILFYENDIEFARTVKRVLPLVTVILRTWPDGDIHLRETPQQWLDKRKHLSQGGLMLYTTNEPGWDRRLIDWHEQLMTLAIIEKVPLAIFGMSVGMPAVDGWPMAERVLRMAAAHPELFVISLHEYAGGVWGSGFVGGHPQDSRYHPDFTKRENWSKVAVQALMKWHMGRHQALTAYCRKIDIKVRIIVTEWGFDMVGDIGDWLRSLPAGGGYTSNNGWKTLVDDWKRWFPDWDALTAFWEQIRLANEWLYEEVEAQLLYCYGTDGSWDEYRVDNFIEDRLEAYIPLDAVPIEPPKPYPAEPAELGDGLSLNVKSPRGFVNIYASTEYKDSMVIGKVLHDQEVTIYPSTVTHADAWVWYWLTYVKDGVVGKGWIPYQLPPVNPPAPPEVVKKRIILTLPDDIEMEDAIVLNVLIKTLISTLLLNKDILSKTIVSVEG